MKATNPLPYLEEFNQDYGSNILRAVSDTAQRLKRCQRPVPRSLNYALKAKGYRQKHSKEENSVYREIPKNKKDRVYIRENEFVNFGKSFKHLVAHFAKEIKPNLSLKANLKRLDYFKNLMSNKPFSYHFHSLLQSLNSGNHGLSIGPTMERRAALALAILKDRNVISGFEICGEAGEPVALEKQAAKTVNYQSHEEAMSVDILVQLKSKSNAPFFRYIPLQIKSDTSTGFDETKRYITFSASQKQEMQELLPQLTEDFFTRINADNFRINFKRRVLKLGLCDRKIVKNSRKDFQKDIVNKLMCYLEHSQESGELLSLKSPYQNLSFTKRVSAMVKAGFLTPVPASTKRVSAMVKAGFLTPVLAS